MSPFESVFRFIVTAPERRSDFIRITPTENVDLYGLDPNTVKFMQTLFESHVARCAIIGENAMSARIERLFSAGSKIRTCHFRHKSETEAWHWLDAKEIGQDG